MADGQPLLPQHRADLEASGWSEATIRAACAQSLCDAAEIARKLKWTGGADKLGPCLCLPYLDLEGRPNGYAALKPDRPRCDKKGKPHKYELPKGEPNRLYTPAGVGPLTSDPAVPLILTEGIKKAVKATQEGFPTLGLSGVWNWTVKGVRKLIDELSAVAWTGRRVSIVFDSDAAHNEHVARAERELVELLRTHGAIVKVVRLPGRPDGRKVGLDDYLLTHPADDLRRLLDPPPPPPPPKKSLSEVVATFRKWLHLPDPAPLSLTLAAVVANRAAGNPVWLLLVGPPGSGKTEIVGAVAAAAPDVHLVGTLTEAALLSGSSRKDCTAASTGGLLRKMGEFGVLALKDFGSILSMNKDGRAAVLAALREVYDGKWVRHVGADGGRELSWSGKCGLIGGSTPAVDQHYSLIAALGERFAYLRMPGEGRRDRGRRAVQGAAEEMRAELSEAVAGLLAHAAAPADRAELSDDDRERLVCLADLTAVCRTAIPRSLNGREITDVPMPEECTRLGIVFRLLWDAFPALGIGPERGWELLSRLALDSIPVIRRNALSVLVDSRDWHPTSYVAGRLGLPTTTVRRALEELHCYRVVDLDRRKEKNLAVLYWKASAWLRETLAAARVPRIPECAYSLGKPSPSSTSNDTPHPVGGNSGNAEESAENKGFSRICPGCAQGATPSPDDAAGCGWPDCPGRGDEL